MYLQKLFATAAVLQFAHTHVPSDPIIDVNEIIARPEVLESALKTLRLRFSTVTMFMSASENFVLGHKNPFQVRALKSSTYVSAININIKIAFLQ